MPQAFRPRGEAYLASVASVLTELRARYNQCYTKGMKTAVSLPDALFRSAEAAARKLRVSRSQLYATALREFLERRRNKNVTERLNEVYSKEPATLDPVMNAAQLRALKNDPW